MLSLIANLGANVSGFMRAMDQIRGAAKTTGDQIASKFGSDLKSTIFGGVTIGGALRFVSSVTALAKEAKKLASEYGISTDEAQQLAVASERTGGSVEEVAAAMNKVAAMRAKVVAGDEKSLALTKALGLETAVVTDGNRSNLDVLRQIAEAAERQGGSYAAQSVAMQLVGEKAQAVFATMAALKNLGEIQLISAGDVDELVKAEATLQDMNRQLLVASAPRLGFWARVLGRGDKLEREQPDQWFNLTRALFAEIVDAGPTSSAALNAEEILKARQRMAGKNLPTLESLGISPAVESGKVQSVPLNRGAGLTAGSIPEAGGLASAGLFFGGAGSMLYRETKTQTEIQRQSLHELRRLQAVIREEL